MMYLQLDTCRTGNFPDDTPQLALQISEMRRDDRAKIDLEGSLRWNGVHRNSTPNDSEIEGSSGNPVRPAGRESVNGCCEGLDGIGTPKIRPAMSSGTSHDNSKSPAAKSLVGDAMKTSAVQCNKFTVSATPRRSAE